MVEGRFWNEMVVMMLVLTYCPPRNSDATRKQAADSGIFGAFVDQSEQAIYENLSIITVSEFCRTNLLVCRDSVACQ